MNKLSLVRMRSATGGLLQSLTASGSVGRRVREGWRARALGVLIWALGVALAALLVPFAPPTYPLGSGGWALAGVLLIGAGAIIRRRLTEVHEPGDHELLLATGFGVVTIGVLQWLGGPRAPFEYLFAIPVVYVASTQRPARFLFSMSVTILAACAPLIYASDRGRGQTFRADLLLVVLAAATRIVCVALRSQRRAVNGARRESERLAREDPVTGLGNRRSFEESLGLEVARALRNQSAVSVIVADIDDFGRINDRFGREQGDIYLRAVAAVLRENARAGDECFRVGGDEFLVLMPNTDRTEAEVLRTRLADVMHGAASLEMGSQRVRLTFGVAERGDGETGLDLLAAANSMLQAGKLRQPAYGQALSGDPAGESLADMLRLPAEAPPLALQRRRRRYVDQALFMAVAAVVAAGFLYLGVLLITNASLGPALPLVVVTSAAAAVCLAAWHRDREAAVAAADAGRRDALRSARLSRKIASLHEAGEHGDPDEVGVLVVRLAVNLVDAQKGILLASPGDDGPLEVGGSVGLPHELGDHPELQRVALRALGHQSTVRVAHIADRELRRELQNLVAIPLYAQGMPSGVVICANREGGFAELDDGMLLSLGDQAASALQNGRLRAAARRSYVTTVRMLLDAIRITDPSLGGHSLEVSKYVERAADALGLSGWRKERLVFGSMLHDIGKIGIPQDVLLKPGPLTPEERELVQTHPLIGARLVQQVDALRDLADGILHHHERLDGNGYPDHLPAEQISLDARVIAVADSFSAMIADRPYGSPKSIEAACLELERHSGTQFDDKVVKAFVAEVRRNPLPIRANAMTTALDEPRLAHVPTPTPQSLGTGQG